MGERGIDEQSEVENGVACGGRKVRSSRGLGEFNTTCGAGRERDVRAYAWTLELLKTPPAGKISTVLPDRLSWHLSVFLSRVCPVFLLRANRGEYVLVRKRRAVMHHILDGTRRGVVVGLNVLWQLYGAGSWRRGQ